jgi:O-antigen/teichoic acid export membrane protein
VLSLGDWLVDLGTTDVFVRDISRDPDSAPKLLRVLSAAKLLQIPGAILLLTAVFGAFRYPAPVIQAGILGSLNLIFFGGVLVYRVVFRVAMVTERENLAEILSVAAMIPMVLAAIHWHGGVAGLIAGHVASRAIFFLLCWMMGRGLQPFPLPSATLPAVLATLRASAAIGLIGFLIGGYEALDVLLLSKLGTLTQLAWYSAAQRLIWPLPILLTAVGATFFPVLSSLRPGQRARFEEVCQNSFDTVFVLCGVAAASLTAGAVFYLRLLGKGDLDAGAPALRVLAFLCFAKAVGASLGPALFTVRAQNAALGFVATALVAKAAVVSFLVPYFGYMGVAYGSLAIEVCCAAIPAIVLLYLKAGYRLRLRTASLAVALAAICGFLPLALQFPPLAGAVAAPLAYVVLAFASGLVKTGQVRQMLRWKTA